MRELPPAKQKSLATGLVAVCAQLLATANLALNSGMVAAASQLVSLTLTLYAVMLALEE